MWHNQELCTCLSSLCLIRQSRTRFCSEGQAPWCRANFEGRDCVLQEARKSIQTFAYFMILGAGELCLYTLPFILGTERKHCKRNLVVVLFLGGCQALLAFVLHNVSLSRMPTITPLKHPWGATSMSWELSSLLFQSAHRVWRVWRALVPNPEVSKMSGMRLDRPWCNYP